MTSPPRPAPVLGADTPALLADVLAALAFGGAAAEAEVLTRVLDVAVELRSLTVRDAGGDVVARAGRGDAAYDVAPRARRPLDDVWSLDVPLLRRGRRVGILTALSARPFTADVAALLTAVGNAVALSLGDPADVAAQAVLDVEADLAALSAELDETVGAALVAVRHTDAGAVPAAVGAALRALRQIRRDLQATSLEGGLRVALAGLRQRGASVEADDPAIDRVGPAASVLVERVAELACRNAVGPPRITVNVEGVTVKLRVESADNGGDASELARWRRRAAALRGELRHWPGVVELTLPIHLGGSARPGRHDGEGRHDDGPDL